MSEKTQEAEPGMVELPEYVLADLLALAPLEVEDAEASEALKDATIVDIDGAFYLVPELTHDAACWAAHAAANGGVGPTMSPGGPAYEAALEAFEGSFYLDAYALQKGQPVLPAETYVRHLLGDEAWPDAPASAVLAFDIFAAVASLLSVEAEDQRTDLAVRKARAEAEAAKRVRQVRTIAARDAKLERAKGRPAARAKMLKIMEKNRAKAGSKGAKR